MRAAVITFPGSNCEDDTVFTLSQNGFGVDRVWHKDRTSFGNHDLLVLPGGFSYGDYLRCGAIAALSPVATDVREFAEKGGAVLGICNGFQTLCEMGLLPGALTANRKLKFICQNVFLRLDSIREPWTTQMKSGEVIRIPMAHGDGRYWIDADGLQKLKSGNQILLSYCNQKGETTDEANSNGSTSHIAGICNERGNVFGLMPHPERATDLGSLDGLKFWKSLTHSLKGRA